MPKISFSDFKKMKVEEVKKMQSSIITSDGEYLAIVIVPQTGYIKEQAEYLAETSNGAM